MSEAGGGTYEKGGLPEGRPPLFVSVIAPRGCDLLLFFSRSGSGISRSSGSVGSSRSSSGVGRSSVSTGGSSFGASSGGVSAGSGSVGTGFSGRVGGRSFGGGGFVSSLLTASGEGEHAGGNGDSSKLLHDVWAP